MAIRFAGRARRFAHRSLQLDLTVPEDFEYFYEKFESHVPQLDSDLVREFCRAEHGTVRPRRPVAPDHGFFRYGKIDAAANFDGPWACHGYLLGNYIITDWLLARHPAAFLHSALRAVVYRDVDAVTHICLDHPSTSLRGFKDSTVDALAHALDERLTLLFDSLGVPLTLLLPTG